MNEQIKKLAVPLEEQEQLKNLVPLRPARRRVAVLVHRLAAAESTKLLSMPRSQLRTVGSLVVLTTK